MVEPGNVPEHLSPSDQVAGSAVATRAGPQFGGPQSAGAAGNQYPPQAQPAPAQEHMCHAHHLGLGQPQPLSHLHQFQH